MNDEISISSKNISVDDLMHGYVRHDGDGAFSCLYCGERRVTDAVYPVGGEFLLAEAAMRRHIDSAHGGPFAALMAATKDGSSGLTDVQRSVVAAVFEGKSDREIAVSLGGKSESTVRNHRFNLRRRALEARYILALTGLMEKNEKPGADFVAYHPAMPVSDERTMVGEDEAIRIEAKYFSVEQGDGMVRRLVLKNFPKKQKEKLVILRRLAERFERGKFYTEPEINAVLSPVWGDYVTLRRYLIEYRFMDRKPDGSAYWRS
ncbi:MAG: DUF2087 domain-containing protein [Rectinemataceae bacterium]